MYDLIIKNGLVIDGTGAYGIITDVAIKCGKIERVGSNLGDAKQIIDASGLVVTPGFIDSHSHSDITLFSFPEQIEKSEQGITTSIGGQCGTGLWPACRSEDAVSAEDFMNRAQQIPQGSNLAMFVGHRAIRRAVMGMEKRDATAKELEQMAELLREGIKAGALGISFGLIYTPSCYAKTDELIYLAKVVKECGGMISVHIRNEADRVIESVEEMISVAKAANVRMVISHHKAMFAQNHGKVKTTLEIIRKANDEGLDIYCDVYPYVASSTALAVRFIPDEYINYQLSEYMRDEELRKKFKEMNMKKWGDDLSWVQLNTCKAYPQYSGKKMTEASQMHGKDVYETLFDILRDEPSCHASFLSMDERDVEEVMAWERTMICTDSMVVGDSVSYHPRLRGSFPRTLGRYVRERKVVSLPEMIRKMTSLPAYVYGLDGKGKISEGYDADICVFDPDTVIDRADFSDASKRAEGLRYVIVGGKITAENAVYNGERSGRVMLINKG